MNTCPCCSQVLLRHARHGSIYWFCPHCWQEMPDPSLFRESSQQSFSSFPRLSSLLATR